MGLAVVHGIVKGYGGGISVESAQGKGSAFHVFLPRSMEQTIEIIEKAESPGQAPRGSERILFIDDEESIVDIGHFMLKSFGYNVVVQHGSIEGLQAFEQEPHSFDLVITDQTMPHMTGYDLAQKIMNIRPDIPIILCTGYSETVSEEQANALGIKAFVMKPLNWNNIAKTVRRVLDNR